MSDKLEFVELIATTDCFLTPKLMNIPRAFGTEKVIKQKTSRDSF